MVILMLKRSIRLPEDKAKVEKMNTQKQIMGYMIEKYMGGSNVVMITIGDLDKLPYPDKFSTAISNYERVLECVTMITMVGLDNKINERHLMSMERSCLFSTRKTT